MTGAVKRPYQSAVRTAQANATRLTVIQAAARLFVELGYGATSVDAIAEAAGVGRATVFASVGGKPELLKTAYDVALVGDDEPVPLPQRPWARPVAEERDPRRMLELYAAMVCVVADRVAQIYEAIRGAATAQPDARPVWDKIQEERSIGASNIVRMLLDRGGQLRPGLDPKAAADLVWVLADPSMYHLLVNRRGWEPERYVSWLAETLKTQLAAPDE